MVGNPIMHHLLLGIDPVELGGAPFALATDSPLDLRAAELGLTLHPGARVYTLPCIAGHVGADAAAMILAERPDLSEKLTLLVDVGTKDRKSTRLNSSHDQISYAVFCLKK